MKDLVLPGCGDIVRRHDPDRFLMTMVLPADRREDLWALYAFNYEIARTREAVTEPLLGRIRLQWWRDEIARLYDGAREGAEQGGGVLPTLAAAIRRRNLPRQDLDALIDAREADLAPAPPPTLAALESYAAATHAPLVRLARLTLGREGDEAAVRNAAVAYSLTGLLRAVPFHASCRRCLLPADLMAEYGIREQALYDGAPGPGFPALARIVAGRARECAAAAHLSGDKLIRSMNALSSIYINKISGIMYDFNAIKENSAPAFLHIRFLIKNKI